MKAGAEEESLQFAIKGGKSDRIMKAIEALPGADKKAMSMVEGDWQVPNHGAHAHLVHLVFSFSRLCCA